jgi:competence protein ComEA
VFPIPIARHCAQLLFAFAIPFLPNHVSAAGKDWEKLENCRLIPNKDNDGDSFHIQCEGTEYLVRLYLVDAPETKGGEMADRLIEQANYFGITVLEVVEIGRQAKKFVEGKLSEPFTVQTRKASGLGRSNIERFYGFVQTKDGDLGQLLVANGLARVHGTPAARPGSSKSSEEIETLHRLEQRARQKKLGGWSQTADATAGTPQPMQTIALPSPSQTPSQPSVVVSTTFSPPPRTPAAKPGPSVVVDSGKLDINTATKQQLEKIPGIGDALSDRIIAARPFKSADDLRKVHGIGSGKRYEQVRPYFK